MSDPLMNSIVAGSAAAVFQTTVSYPFEFLKTGLQLHRALPNMAPFNMMHQIKVYFAGCSALNAGTLLKTATRFTTFDRACQLLHDPELPQGAAISGPRLLAAGMITGFMESLLIIPFENIKTTMIENALALSEKSGLEPSRSEAKSSHNPQALKGSRTVPYAHTSMTGQSRPTFHARKEPALHPRQKWAIYYDEHPSRQLFTTIQEMFRTRGLRGFVQGTAPTIIRQTANSAVRFTSYTSLKQVFSPDGPINEYYAFALGFVSSCAVVAVTQPIDVVKTRMQSKYTWVNYKNSLNCAYRIFVEEGFTKFWKGWAPRLMKVGLSGGVSFGVYQYVDNLMKAYAGPQEMGHD
ncbi:hypothetical protein ACU8KH_04503 [Lachancea thermotolerans]